MFARALRSSRSSRPSVWKKPLGPLSHSLGARVVIPSMGLHTSIYKRDEVKRSPFAPHDTFVRRHIGPSDEEIPKMLKVVGYEKLDDLIDATVPSSIRSEAPLLPHLPERGETESLAEFKAMMGKNKVYKTFLGAGYYNTHTPNVILRNIIENPGWYTPYTPYQAEISQGRLEMLLNFQTMVADLTGLPISNASLLDEATAAAEAMYMCAQFRTSEEQNIFLVSSDVHPQTIAVVKTRAAPLGIKVKTKHHSRFDLSEGNVFGMLVSYPATNGKVDCFAELTEKAHAAGAKVVATSDLLALTHLTPPGEWGADVVVGSTQRFGVPLGFGGPHAAFMSTRTDWMRKMPGRVIGVSKDSNGNPALRMAMQTREQHIRRDKATSNICTAQALLANVSAAYAIYHGPKGLKEIGTKVHAAAKTFAVGLTKLGFTIETDDFFDTVHVNIGEQSASPADDAASYIKAARKKQMNLRYIDTNNLYVSFDEVNATSQSLNELFQIFAEVKGVEMTVDADKLADEIDFSFNEKFARKSAFLTHPVFNSYHNETDMLRYIFYLQGKDLGLQTAMIPLGSCTMKLNATSEMIPVTWPEVGGIHPFAPKEQVQGYYEMLEKLCADLAEITGFHSVSVQPNAGSQGEYAGLMVIQEYQRSRGQGHRNTVLIPTSAHGTNPASAALCGCKIVLVKCDAKGNIDVNDLREKAEKHKDELSALMVTYPSTHGVFENEIKEVCKIIHEHGGQVYMDGANMNAQVGLCSPGAIGADVCHLNLHKTFCIPHGGGGPGMGPIGVAQHLAPFLPTHPFHSQGRDVEKATGAVSAAPFSSASILPISYMYIHMMGGSGLTKATKMAILNANYMAKRLAPHYDILYSGENGNVAHEFIIDLRPIKAATGISEEDVAKRLIDFNFHAPTMSFPVAGTLMVEPTESEPLRELDRFCDAMIKIREEIKDVASGKLDKTDNPLKGAPHTAETVLSDGWNRKYTREQAAYPLPYLRKNKFWATVGRLDNVFGDRNLICSCPPLESYEK